MDKTFDHQKFGLEIYKLWEQSGVFSPKKNPKRKPFCMIMPPPNANDNLHIGHARFVTIQDAITRYHRMRGEPTLWLPGADHAGIETQYVFEKKLEKEGRSRFDFNRESLYQMIWEYVQKNKKNMESQLRALGASCDWSRNKFTLDPDIIKIVYKTFKKLYDDGLIYRGEKIINYCPRCGTAYSQLEVDIIEKDDLLYYLDYGPVKVATTRPETIFADVAIAVNPKDPRYKNLIGKRAILPLVKRELPIIADPLVDIDFGTGALKITPGHDATDFEIGKKHNLPIITVIDNEGKMINLPKKYIGLKASDARREVVNDLERAGKILKRETIHHLVNVCYRDKTIIEPLICKQWFIKVAPLANRALAAIKEKRVTFLSPRFEKVAKHWLRNLKDWNISRQIVWGIRIPAFRCQKCLEWTVTEGETPVECRYCRGKKIVQDVDTFDTWFSSSQWPFATLLSCSKPKTKNDKSRLIINIPTTDDFKYFYPTSLMETAYDIIPFWVIRMIMLGLYATGAVPFEKVLIHGLVRDKEGQKISKSKGNVIDPMEMIMKYGADALRMGLIWGALIENDISLSEDNIRGQRNFANKLWNIARYVFSKPAGEKAKKDKDDIWIIEELKKTIKKTTRAYERYRLNDAAEEIYNFIWHKFADDYLEKTKKRREDSQKNLEYVLQESLKLLHPLMPFVTETIWQRGRERFDSPTLIGASWPKSED